MRNDSSAHKVFQGILKVAQTTLDIAVDDYCAERDSSLQRYFAQDAQYKADKVLKLLLDMPPVNREKYQDLIDTANSIYSTAQTIIESINGKED